MTSSTRLPYAWGATPGEMAAAWPAERFAVPGSAWAFRAVDVAAPARTTYEWICQLRRAPYSYDLVDNLGRRSPRELDRSVLDVQVGQRIATIFRVVDVVPGESITMQVTDPWPARLFGPAVITYAAVRVGDASSRLVGVIGLPPAGQRLLARANRWVVLWGDLVMMRKQLLTLAELAGRD